MMVFAHGEEEDGEKKMVSEMKGVKWKFYIFLVHHHFFGDGALMKRKMERRRE